MAENRIENLEILKYPDPRLRVSCPMVVDFDAGLADLTRRMLELMKQNNGVGLAGPQVGNRQRLFVCNHTGEPEDDLVVINPELSELEGWAEASEGCLSIPDCVSLSILRSSMMLASRNPAMNLLYSISRARQAAESRVIHKLRNSRLRRRRSRKALAPARSTASLAKR